MSMSRPNRRDGTGNPHPSPILLVLPLFVTLFLPLLLLSLPPVLAQQKEYLLSPRAEVLSLSGHARVLKPRSPVWQPLKPKEVLTEGDKIRTGKSSYLVLLLPDKSTVTVGADTELVLVMLIKRTPELTTRIKLFFGKLWINVRGFTEKKHRMEIHTPQSKAKTGGTIFEVAARGKVARFAVWNGTILVGEGRVPVHEGQEMTMTGHLAGKVSPFDRKEPDPWQRLNLEIDSQMEEWLKNPSVPFPLKPLPPISSSSRTGAPQSGPLQGSQGDIPLISPSPALVFVNDKPAPEGEAHPVGGEGKRYFLPLRVKPGDKLTASKEGYLSQSVMVHDSSDPNLLLKRAAGIEVTQIETSGKISIKGLVRNFGTRKINFVIKGTLEDQNGYKIQEAREIFALPDQASPFTLTLQGKAGEEYALTLLLYYSGRAAESIHTLQERVTQQP